MARQIEIGIIFVGAAGAITMLTSRSGIAVAIGALLLAGAVAAYLMWGKRLRELADEEERR